MIDKSLTIEGQERRVTISGNRVTRVFLIQYAYSGVHLNRLTIADGWSGSDNGGGIKNVSGSGKNLSNTSSCGGSFTKSDAALLGSLGNYGGVTQSIPLLPGSAAIDAGANCADTFDQRGFSRNEPCDIGAFESKGFTITPDSGSNNQIATLMSAFPAALVVHVGPKQPGEPVDGGVVTFTTPASGASAALSASAVTISGVLASITAAANDTHSATENEAVDAMSGQASVTATANNTAGTYVVSAASAGASPASFTLTNTQQTAVGLQRFRAAAAAPARYRACGARVRADPGRPGAGRAPCGGPAVDSMVRRMTDTTCAPL